MGDVEGVWAHGEMGMRGGGCPEGSEREWARACEEEGVKSCGEQGKGKGGGEGPAGKGGEGEKRGWGLGSPAGGRAAHIWQVGAIPRHSSFKNVGRRWSGRAAEEEAEEPSPLSIVSW